MEAATKPGAVRTDQPVPRAPIQSVARGVFAA